MRSLLDSKQFVSILTEPSAHLTGTLALKFFGPESSLLSLKMIRQVYPQTYQTVFQNWKVQEFLEQNLRKTGEELIWSNSDTSSSSSQRLAPRRQAKQTNKMMKFIFSKLMRIDDWELDQIELDQKSQIQPKFESLEITWKQQESCKWESN